MLSTVAVFLALFLATTTQAYTTEHMDTDSFDVSVVVDFDTVCSSESDFNLIVTVPRGSSILNVLEHSNVYYNYMQNFKVSYGIHPTSYTLISINTEGDSPSLCSWKVSTSPVTSIDDGVFPLGEVFVTNVGMTVTFHFTTTTATPVKPNAPSVVFASSGPTGTVTVNVQYTTACPSPSSSNSSTPVSFTLGDSALNAIESAASEEDFVFIASNTFGSYYLIHSLSSSSVSPSCKWCEYYTPPYSTEYSLTADVNNFIVPISGGELTLRYQPTCGVTVDNFKFIESRDIPFPVPPHYNPFMYVAPKKKLQCNEKEDGSHCRAD